MSDMTTSMRCDHFRLQVALPNLFIIQHLLLNSANWGGTLGGLKSVLGAATGMALPRLVGVGKGFRL